MPIRFRRSRQRRRRRRSQSSRNPGPNKSFLLRTNRRKSSQEWWLRRCTSDADCVLRRWKTPNATLKRHPMSNHSLHLCFERFRLRKCFITNCFPWGVCFFEHLRLLEEKSITFVLRVHFFGWIVFKRNQELENLIFNSKQWDIFSIYHFKPIFLVTFG